MSYVVGNVIKSTATFSMSGVALNPTTVTFRVLSPSAVVTTPAVTNTATGTYTAQQLLNASGFWHLRWESTGTGQAAHEESIYVKPSNLP